MKEIGISRGGRNSKLQRYRCRKQLEKRFSKSNGSAQGRPTAIPALASAAVPHYTRTHCRLQRLGCFTRFL
jgi:hypothetical protein